MSDCILYTGNSKRTPRTRDIWRKKHGEIPDGLWVLHSCNNQKCRNVDHFYLGTPKDNYVDTLECGHFLNRTGTSQSTETRNKISNKIKGEGNGMAKLTKEQVSEIFDSPDTQVVIAKRYGVSQGTVSRIKRKGKWS